VIRSTGQCGPKRGKRFDGALSDAKHGAGTCVGTGAGGQEKENPSRAVKRGRVGKGAGAPHFSGPRRTCNELYAGLQVKPRTCEFHTNNVEYLGFIIPTEGLGMDPAKITTIIDWLIPKKLCDVCSFLGFGNFYRHFIQD